MLKDFKKKFYTPPRRMREIQKQLLISLLTHNLIFFQQQSATQQEERKKPQKETHTEIPTSEEQPRKQIKSVFHQEVSEYNLLARGVSISSSKWFQTSRKRSESPGRARNYHSGSSMERKILQTSERLNRKERLMPYESIIRSSLTGRSLQSKNTRFTKLGQVKTRFKL